LDLVSWLASSYIYFYTTVGKITILKLAYFSFVISFQRINSVLEHNYYHLSHFYGI